MSAPSVDTITHARRDCKRKIWNSAPLRQSPPTARHHFSNNGSARPKPFSATFFSLWFCSRSLVWAEQKKNHRPRQRHCSVVLRLLKMHTNRLALRIFLLLVVAVFFYFLFFYFRVLFCFELDDGAKHAYVCVHLKWLCHALHAPLAPKAHFAQNEL